MPFARKLERCCQFANGKSFDGLFQNALNLWDTLGKKTVVDALIGNYARRIQDSFAHHFPFYYDRVYAFDRKYKQEQLDQKKDDERVLVNSQIQPSKSVQRMADLLFTEVISRMLYGRSDTLCSDFVSSGAIFLANFGVSDG